MMSSFSQVAKAFTIGPEKATGPLVAQSKVLNKCRSGNSFACSMRTNHCSGCDRDNSTKQILLKYDQY